LFFLLKKGGKMKKTIQSGQIVVIHQNNLKVVIGVVKKWKMKDDNISVLLTCLPHKVAKKYKQHYYKKEKLYYDNFSFASISCKLDEIDVI